MLFLPVYKLRTKEIHSDKVTLRPLTRSGKVIDKLKTRLGKVTDKLQTRLGKVIDKIVTRLGKVTDKPPTRSGKVTSNHLVYIKIGIKKGNNTGNHLHPFPTRIIGLI